MDDSAQGGNDTLTVTNSGLGSHADLYGDARTLQNNAQGGNDILTATDSGLGSLATLVGDAETCTTMPTAGMTPSLVGLATILCTAMPNSTPHFPRLDHRRHRHPKRRGR